MKDCLPTQPNQPQTWEEGSIPPPRTRAVHQQLAEGMNPADDADGSRLGRVRISLGRQTLVLVFLTVFSISTYYAVSQFVITAVMVRGRSMTPTLQDGERYFLNRWLLLFREPQRGDVVVIRDTGHDDFAVKRIIGLPSETIELRSGMVFIDGRPLKEPYLAARTLTFAPNTGNLKVQLNDTQYFVMGDNRANSEDSRYYGALRPDQIVGVLVQ